MKLRIFICVLCFVLFAGEIFSENITVRRFGNSGEKLGVIGINVGEYASNDRTSFSRLLKAGIKAGGVFINTSPFVDGSEKFVAENLGPSARKNCVLATRWRTDNDNGEDDFIRSFNASLKNLKVETIDCVIIDEIKELRYLRKNSILRAFHNLKKQNKTKYIGVYVKKTEKEPISKILYYIIKSGDYDFVVLDYNTDNFNEAQDYLEGVARSGMGVIVSGTIEDSMKNEELARRIAARSSLPLQQAVIQWAVSSSRWISSVLVPPYSEFDMDLILKGGVEEDNSSIFDFR